jgi:hypothetical protein
MSRKKLAVYNEQVGVTDVAQAAAALRAEKEAIEARLAARAEREAAEKAHVARVLEAGALYTEAEADVLFERQRDRVLTKLEDAVYEAQEWERYLACNPLPDVRVPAQLNAFVSVFREADPATNAPHHSLVPTLEACAQAELVAAELQTRAALAREEGHRDEHLAIVSSCDRYTNLLRSLEARKLDELTCKFLTRADEYEESAQFGTPATRSFTVCHATSSVGFGLFVHNSSRTDRIKRVEFADMGVTVELPQSLQKARTAIRIVRTLYDSVAVVQPVAKSGDDAGERKEKDGASSASSSATKSSPSRPGTRGADHVAGGNKMSSISLASLPAGSKLALGDDVDEALRDPTGLFDFDARPPPMANAHAHFVSVGGVIELQQLLLPPPATKLKSSWTMRDITLLDKRIINVPYPSEEAAAAAAAQSGSSSSALASAHAAALAPLRVRFTLPPHIYLSSEREPLFGFWDSAAHDGLGGWKQDGVSILEFEPKSRLVLLSVPTIKPLAVIQPRALDFPYRSWSMQPVRVAPAGSDDYYNDDGEIDESMAASICRIEVTGSRFSVCVEVSGALTRLVSPSAPFLARFRDEWTTPGVLLQQLASVGINVAPSDSDALYARKPLKSALLVSTLHAHLSLLTGIFDTSFCAHNVSRSSTSASFRMRLNKHSVVLASAAAKKALADWEAQQEEAERRDEEITAEQIRAFPAALRERQVLRDENGNEVITKDGVPDADAVEREIAAMEADERAAAAAAERERLAEKARRDAHEADELARAAALVASTKKVKKVPFGWEDDALPRPAPPPLTTEQKYDLGFEWVTVLAEIIEAPEDPALAASAAAAAGAPPAAVTKGKGASSSSSARGSAHESLPPGVLLRFTLVRGETVEEDGGGPAAASAGAFDSRPLEGCTAHFSLRRCLLEYFADKTPHDLCTAMSMARPNFGTEDGSSTATTIAAAQMFHFIPFEPRVLQTQQTVRRTLNLLRPLIFC